MSSSTNTFFAGSIAENYDRFLGPLLFEPYAIDLVSRIRTDQYVYVLELACGTGRVTYHLDRQFSGSAKITATDLNPDMIAIARIRVPGATVQWMTADMQQLPFPDHSFDFVICQFGIMFVPDKLKAIKEASRVLKKGGTFLFNTWDKIENNGVPNIANRVVTNFFNNTPPVFYTVPFCMHQPEGLKVLLREGGFSKIEIELVKKKGRSPTALDAARGMIEGSPIFKEITDKDPTAIAPIIERAGKEMSTEFGDNPLVSPLQAWVGQATK